MKIDIRSDRVIVDDSLYTLYREPKYCTVSGINWARENLFDNLTYFDYPEQGRLPTRDEFKELLECRIERDSNGVWFIANDGRVYFQYGKYWSKTIHIDGVCYYLDLTEKTCNVTYAYNKNAKMFVRQIITE
jgi:hypothetical protein